MVFVIRIFIFSVEFSINKLIKIYIIHAIYENIPFLHGKYSARMSWK